MLYECPLELVVMEAVAARRWPEGCDAELRAHVAGCESCSSAVEIARAFSEERRVADRVRVPSAERVWWRAQFRARQEAARTASRPLTVAQGLAAAGAVGLTAASLSLVGPADLLQSVGGKVLSYVPSRGAVDMALAATSLPQVAMVLAVAAAGLLLMPLALYLVLSD